MTSQEPTTLYDESAVQELRQIVADLRATIADALAFDSRCDLTAVIGMAVHRAAEVGVRHAAIYYVPGARA